MMQLKLVTARQYETFSRHFRHVWPQYLITSFQTVSVNYCFSYSCSFCRGDKT